jgi:hypothetical protein
LASATGVLAWWDRHRDAEVGVEELFTLATAEKLLDGVLGDKGERSKEVRKKADVADVFQCSQVHTGAPEREGAGGMTSATSVVAMQLL